MPVLSKEERIIAELERLTERFEVVDGNQRAIVGPLLQNAAFMKVTLEDLQERINEEGVTEIYQNGANQQGIKQSATLQSYNSLIKNYASVIKTLAQLLPPEKRAVESPYQRIREKTEEERAEDRQRDEERRKQIEAEIARAVEIQRRQREVSAGR